MKNISNINIITIIILIFVILAVIYHNFYHIKQSSQSVQKIKSKVLLPSYWKKGNKISFRTPPNHYHAEYSPHNLYN